MDDIDYTKTTENVRIFFGKDFRHYINLGGIHPSQLSSPQLDLAPGGHSYTNNVEKSLVSTMSKAERARWVAGTILLAVNECSDFEDEKHRSIIMKFFIKKMTNFQTSISINISENRLRREKPKACVEFAERLNYWKGERNCPELPDLIAFVDK